MSVPHFDFSVNHLCVLLHGETQVAPTFTVEDILLLFLVPGLCWTQLLVYLDFVVLRHAVFVLSLWCLLCVASQLGHRRSCQYTEAVGYPPF